MQDIKTVLKTNKQKINTRISKLISEYKKRFGKIGSTSTLALERLEQFALGGKGVRGSLSIISADMFGSTEKDILLDIAASLELLQASLLIHDDIMDNDLVRRGNPSLFAQYIENGKQLETKDALHYGRSMGICIGDVGFFIAMSIVQHSLKNHQQKDKVLELLHKELIIVGLAQMDDVTFAASKKFPTTDEIVQMYLYKTAHYTFSLPLSLGAILANQPDEIITLMEKLGEHIGILFQLKDDEIGIYGTEQETGKPVGSDLRENKKTIFRTILEQKMSDEEKNKLADNDMAFYLSLLEKYTIQKRVSKIIDEHSIKAERILSQLSLNTDAKELLGQLIAFVTKRSS